MPTLHISRLRCIAAEAYRCIYNLSPEYIRDLVELKQSVYNFRYTNTARVLTVKTTAYGKSSFRFEAARVWNSLPNEMRTANSFSDFRRLVRTWTGPQCGCVICSGSGVSFFCSFELLRGMERFPLPLCAWEWLRY